MRLLPLALLASSSLAAPMPVMGIPTVTDRDTLVIGGVKVRLFGIEAPDVPCAR